MEVVLLDDTAFSNSSKLNRVRCNVDSDINADEVGLVKTKPNPLQVVTVYSRETPKIRNVSKLISNRMIFMMF